MRLLLFIAEYKTWLSERGGYRLKLKETATYMEIFSCIHKKIAF